MTEANSAQSSSRVEKIVQAIAITPEDAKRLVDGYRQAFERKHGRSPLTDDDRRRISNKLIVRYSALAATTGAVTAAPSVIPGVGTAVAVVGGGAVDIAASLKIQVDLCMCLVELYQTDLEGEDKKHMAFVLALAGSLEQMLANGGKVAVQKIAQKLVYQYLKGPLLVTIKELFKKVAITFTQKAMAKAIPAGVGIAFSGSTNYVMTTVVGKVAVAVLAKDVK